MGRRLTTWPVIGAGIVLVVCLLLAHNQLRAIFAGRTPDAATPAPCRVASTDQPSGMIVRAQADGAFTIALTAAPDAFGTYTVTVAALDATCAPLQDATVDMVLTMLDMPMAPLHIVAQAVGAPSGSYQGQAVLMAGRWRALVRVLARGATQPAQATFQFDAR